MIIDTPGLDDNGMLGEKRIEKTNRILKTCDIAILVTEANRKLNSIEEELLNNIKIRNIPYIIVKNKMDLLNDKINLNDLDGNSIFISTINNNGIEDLKNKISRVYQKFYNKNNNESEIKFVGNLINKDDIVILVIPIDSSSPKGRIILPQQQAIRDILDSHGITIAVKVEELKETIEILNKKPKLVITDSQVFNEVSKIVPKEIPLTSFSILMARYKGFLDISIKGAKEIDNLKNGDKVLISEGCTHHKQCEDIGTVKIPNLIKKYTNKNIEFEWTNGQSFPEDLSKYKMVIHCGGCMLNTNEITYRMNIARKKNIPITNYGILIAYLNGILERTISPLISNENMI